MSRGGTSTRAGASTSTKSAKAEARGPRTQGRAGLVKSTCPTARRPAMRAFPFGGSRTAGRCTVQVTLPGTASHGGSVLLGVLLCSRSAGVSGSPLPPGPRHFGRVQRYRPSAVHRELAHAASSSLELSASFRVLRPTTCSPSPDDLATARRPESASRGVPVPSSRHQQATSTGARSSHAPS